MRATTNALGDVLFGKVRGGILALLFGNPDRTFYFREIARSLVGISPGALQREVKLLQRLGLVERTQRGRQVYYKANRDHPIFAELRQLILKTVGAIHVLRSALSPIAARISIAFVYGSMAKGQETAGSDIDLFVVGSVRLEEVFEVLSGVETSAGRAVNPVVYSAKEFKHKLAAKNHFVSAVISGPKIFLIGDEDELREVGGVRLVETGTH